MFAEAFVPGRPLAMAATGAGRRRALSGFLCEGPELEHAAPPRREQQEQVEAEWPEVVEMIGAHLEEAEVLA